VVFFFVKKYNPHPHTSLIPTIKHSTFHTARAKTRFWFFFKAVSQFPKM
jgi:hypothetical protein